MNLVTKSPRSKPSYQIQWSKPLKSGEWTPLPNLRGVNLVTKSPRSKPSYQIRVYISPVICINAQSKEPALPWDGPMLRFFRNYYISHGLVDKSVDCRPKWHEFKSPLGQNLQHEQFLSLSSSVLPCTVADKKKFCEFKSPLWHFFIYLYLVLLYYHLSVASALYIFVWKREAGYKQLQYCMLYFFPIISYPLQYSGIVSGLLFLMTRVRIYMDAYTKHTCF